MKENIKYDPEDIESLLLNKEFDELYPEEKSFVLQHIENQDEYNSMRNMLSHISNSEMDEISPRENTLDNLMEKFVTEEKKGFKWWLNSIAITAFPKERTWFNQPGWQMTLATCVMVIGFSLYQDNNSMSDLQNIAEVRKEQKAAEPSEQKPAKKRLNNAVVENELSDDVIQNNTTSPENIKIDDVNRTPTATVSSQTKLKESEANPMPIITDNLMEDKATENAITEATSEEFLLDKYEDISLEQDSYSEIETEEHQKAKTEKPTPPVSTDLALVEDAALGNMAEIRLEEDSASPSITQSYMEKPVAMNSDLISLLYTAP